LCSHCAENKYGRPLLYAFSAQYYGGHKAYLAGGTFSDYQAGRMYLTEEYMIFTKGDKKPSKRWDIIIPLTKVVTERWNIEEKSRRKQISGGGSGIDNLVFGAGVIHESGKSHRLVVPYIDENGIPQEPRFGVSSIGGTDIRKWATGLYNAVVEAKRKNALSLQSISESKGAIMTHPSSQVENSPNVSQEKTDEPLRILKIRLAKGEITKEEYEEMREIIES
jgi:hypothetical protein